MRAHVVEASHPAVGATQQKNRRPAHRQVADEVVAWVWQVLEAANVQPRAPKHFFAFELEVLGLYAGRDWTSFAAGHLDPLGRRQPQKLGPMREHLHSRFDTSRITTSYSGLKGQEHFFATFGIELPVFVDR